jgi:hypothetical protein
MLVWLDALQNKGPEWPRELQTKFTSFLTVCCQSMQAALQTVSNSKLVGPRRHAQSGAPRSWHMTIGRLSQAASMGWYRFPFNNVTETAR